MTRILDCLRRLLMYRKTAHIITRLPVCNEITAEGKARLYGSKASCKSKVDAEDIGRL